MASHSTDAHAPGTDDHARDEPELFWNPLIANFPATDGVTEWEAANPYPSRPPRPERPFPKSAAGWKPDRILGKMRKAAACLRKNESQKKLLETMLPVRNDGRSRSPPPRGARAGQVRNDSSSEEPPREEEEEEEDPPREEEDPPLEYLPHWSTSHSGQEEPPREEEEEEEPPEAEELLLPSSCLREEGFLVLSEKAVELVAWSNGVSVRNLGAFGSERVSEAVVTKLWGAFQRGLESNWIHRLEEPGRSGNEGSFDVLREKALELTCWQLGSGIRSLGSLPRSGHLSQEAVDLRVDSFCRGLQLQGRPS
jgi:hypothetical protein